MMIDYQPLIECLKASKLKAWAELLPEQLASILTVERYGDLPRWQAALEQLPDLDMTNSDLNSAAVTVSGKISEQQHQLLLAILQEFHPWRKGPFDICGIYIDTEWRSDWKWDRISPHMTDLTGRTVLDVGCGSGYHCWRMAGAGARLVIGIDPMVRCTFQHYILEKYIQHGGVHVLPVKMEDLPANMQGFDTVFSMGVLYHRRSPFDHLYELKGALRPNGELILETLVIEGGRDNVLVPTNRYAQMNNVWFIPSCDALINWCEKVGFDNIRLVDVTATTVEEQRTTEWMRFNSLADYLDPCDSGKTIEGYSAPLRATLIANKPG